MKTFKLHLIRHGISEGSEEGQYIGHTDVMLTQKGIAQLEKMKADYEYPLVDAVLSSPLNRCLETARILYPELTPLIFDNLIEYNFGEFEGLTADELKNEKEFGEWLSGDADAAAPFGESNREFSSRIIRCFSDIVNGLIKSGVDNVAVITHGGVIMSVMSAFAVPEAPMHEWLTPNGCGYTLLVTPSVWNHVKKVEAVAHVPIMPDEEEKEAESDDADFDAPFDEKEFIGFYSAENANDTGVK